MKRKLLLLCVLICLTTLFCACAGGTPLGKTAKELEKGKADNTYEYGYNEDTDTLYISINSEKDLEPVFTQLAENVKDQDIGSIFFLTKSLNPERNLMIEYEANISRLECKSMKVLALGSAFQTVNTGSWSALGEKAQLTMMDELPDASNYSPDNRKHLENVKRIWVGSPVLRYVSSYPALEELGIQSETLRNRSISDIDPAAATDEDKSGSTSGEAKEQSEQRDSTYSFEASFLDRSQFEPVTKSTSLKKLLVAPGYKAYNLKENGSGYFFMLQNLKPDLLVNVPEKETEITRAEGADEKSLVAVKDVSLPNLTDATRRSVLDPFLKDQTKSCYDRGKKLKVKEGKPVVYGKALIYQGMPGTNSWSKKKKYASAGKLYWSTDLDGKIATPSLKNDYSTFIYVYPTYVRVGTYDKGTKGYKITMRAQVFDLERGIAYKPVKIGSAMPPQRFTYFGIIAPDKKAGTVSEKKIKKYLKKLKTAAASANKEAATNSASGTA